MLTQIFQNEKLEAASQLPAATSFIKLDVSQEQFNGFESHSLLGKRPAQNLVAVACESA